MDSQPVPRVTEMYILGSENPPSRAEIPPVHTQRLPSLTTQLILPAQSPCMQHDTRELEFTRDQEMCLGRATSYTDMFGYGQVWLGVQGSKEWFQTLEQTWPHRGGWAADSCRRCRSAVSPASHTPHSHCSVCTSSHPADRHEEEWEATVQILNLEPQFPIHGSILF